MTPTPAARIGLIGGGNIARAHLRGYAALGSAARVTALADTDPETLATRTAETGATGYSDYRQLIADPEVDAVDICLPHHLHHDAIVAAAQAGQHLLVEKPLCLTAEEARSVRAAVADSGVTLMCAHNKLYLPAVAKAKELVDSGALGTSTGCAPPMSSSTTSTPRPWAGAPTRRPPGEGNTSTPATTPPT